uniref:Uncharacterized protein n=1 Tax=Tanacetum cinerariifolium TaxID=118510 RepID=A0A699IEC4_TANCI|nr:hypothetical protein [Tanacetum cinerariifolium]
MPIICTECGGIVRGGLYLPCNLRKKDLYNYDPNAYSFDTSNYFPQPQDENYLCNLCGNNSHDGYDCQQQFPLVYEQKPKDSNDLFQKLLKDLKELVEYDQSTSTDRPIFLNDNEDHHVQSKESLDNSSEENVVSKTNQEPPQDSDIHQLIEECSVEVPEQQKQNMEKTMLDLVKICHHKQFLCIHDDVDNLIESALDSKLLSINSINSQRLDKKEQEVKIVEEQLAERRNLAPILSTKEPENSLNMGYKHLSITPEIESDEVTESNAENLLPIPIECEILFDSNNDDLSSDDESFEDIEYVDASVPDPAIVSVEEENVVHREEEESDNSLLEKFLLEFETFCDHSEETRSDNTTHANYSLPEYDSFCFKIKPDQERLINLVENDNSDNSSNDLLLEEADIFLFDNSIPPGIENVADDPEGDVRFLEELLIDDSILSHELSDNNFKDNPSISRPPPKPLDVESFFDLKPDMIAEEISDKLNEDKCFDPGREINVSTKIEDDDYFPFLFVILFFLPYFIFPKPPPAQYLVHQSLAASRRHVTASYWTAASDVAATSAPVNAGQRRSTPPVVPPATGQRRWITVVIGGQRRLVGRSTLTTTGPPVNGGWWADQRAGLGRSGSGLGWVRVGLGLPRGMPRVSHVCTRVSHVCPRGS